MLYLLSPDHQSRALRLKMITQQIRRHAALVALCAGNQVSKIATVLKTDKTSVTTPRGAKLSQEVTSSL